MVTMRTILVALLAFAPAAIFIVPSVFGRELSKSTLHKCDASRGGYYAANPDSCRHYFICDSEGNLYDGDCGQYGAFDPDSVKCEPASRLGCVAPTSEAAYEATDDAVRSKMVELIKQAKRTGREQSASEKLAKDEDSEDNMKADELDNVTEWPTKSPLSTSGSTAATSSSSSTQSSTETVSSSTESTTTSTESDKTATTVSEEFGKVSEASTTASISKQSSATSEVTSRTTEQSTMTSEVAPTTSEAASTTPEVTSTTSEPSNTSEATSAASEQSTTSEATSAASEESTTLEATSAASKESTTTSETLTSSSETSTTASIASTTSEAATRTTESSTMTTEASTTTSEASSTSSEASSAASIVLTTPDTTVPSEGTTITSEIATPTTETLTTPTSEESTQIYMILWESTVASEEAYSSGDSGSTHESSATVDSTSPATQASTSSTSESSTTAPITSSESSTTAPMTSSESSTTAPMTSSESSTTAPMTSSESSSTLSPTTEDSAAAASTSLSPDFEGNQTSESSKASNPEPPAASPPSAQQTDDVTQERYKPDPFYTGEKAYSDDDLYALYEDALDDIGAPPSWLDYEDDDNEVVDEEDIEDEDIEDDLDYQLYEDALDDIVERGRINKEKADEQALLNRSPEDEIYDEYFCLNRTDGNHTALISIYLGCKEYATCEGGQMTAAGNQSCPDKHTFDEEAGLCVGAYLNSNPSCTLIDDSIPGAAYEQADFLFDTPEIDACQKDDNNCNAKGFCKQKRAQEATAADLHPTAKNDCFKFYLCHPGLEDATLYDCPPDTVYVDNVKRCVAWSTARDFLPRQRYQLCRDELAAKTEGGSLCPREFVPHPLYPDQMRIRIGNRCSKYLICTRNGNQIINTCPYPQVFEPNSGICQFKKVPECSDWYGE